VYRGSRLVVEGRRGSGGTNFQIGRDGANALGQETSWPTRPADRSRGSGLLCRRVELGDRQISTIRRFTCLKAMMSSSRMRRALGYRCARNRLRTIGSSTRIEIARHHAVVGAISGHCALNALIRAWPAPRAFPGHAGACIDLFSKFTHSVGLDVGRPSSLWI